MKKAKERMREQKKYFTKEDIFLSRMASILKMPKGVAHEKFSERTISVIRLNNLVADPSEIKKALEDSGAILEPVAWSQDTYIVTNKDKSELGETPAYKRGLFYIQNLSSMIPAIILSPTTEDAVLDMCAAPGSKTTQLASMMNNRGEIVANDADLHRVSKLRAVLDLFNVKNTQIRNEPGGGIGRREEGHYDKVLLDAPCSGEGLIYLRGDKPLRFWNIKKVKPMVKVQKDLIESAFRSLKKGGVMVYSTCTLEPEENEGVVSHLLEKFANANLEEVGLFESEKFNGYKDYVKRGIREWNDVYYNPDVSKTYRVIPGSKMMGFYIAKIVKN
jgi:16S rRNA (cytosine1407-C5)-methyltransferase